jgi:hypothetical protein
MTRKCEKIGHKEIFVLDALFHIFTLCLVLGMFFFLVVSKLERDNLMDEIKSGLKKGFDRMTLAPNPGLAGNLTNLSAVYNEPNETDDTYNSGLKIQCGLILGFLFFSLISVWLTMKWSAKKCPNLGKIVVQNLLLFGSIGVVEYLFFTHFASKFIPVMPSYMAQVVEESV